MTSQKEVIASTAPSATVDAPDDLPTEAVVLVVEDHDLQRVVAVRLARALGAKTVLEVADGREALALLRDRGSDVDLILCDLDMPNMDGMEFVRRLDKVGTTAALAITSAQDPAVLSSVNTMCEAYGITPLGVIEKPVTASALRDLMRRAMAPRPAGRRAGPSPSGEFSLAEILDGLDRRQFVPFFQPKSELGSRRIAGAEALARWQHPERGIIAPGAFIAALEEAGRIDDLTFQMLTAAVAACRRWHDEGMPMTVSVNISLTSLADHGLADRIHDTVRAGGLEASNVILEVTETAAMTQVASALENLARLRMRGFGLSIDDFGTGYASMQQFGRAAFTELKIDRGFVSEMADRREARAIVDASIRMARALDIKAVAEGVETQAEWAALCEAGCDLAQGYLISKPVDEAAFKNFCRSATR